MRPDVARIRDFYRTPLGGFVAAELGRAVADCAWADRPGGLVTLGYAPPVLDKLEGHGTAIALMPAEQGVEAWPDEAAPLAALVDELALPLDDASVANMLLVHALEFSANPSVLLREVWRVLEPEGRVVIIVPNRRRIWSSMERTPFGHGTPWSRRQLEDLMVERMLTPVGCRTALVYPPTDLDRARRRIAGWCERPMLRIAPASGGVLLIEAEKKVVGGIMQRKTRMSLKPATIGNVANLIQK